MHPNDAPFWLLAIESSCDDTSAAVLNHRQVCSNVVARQSVHEAYGGVVPELASRAHQQNIIPVVHQALQQAGISVREVHAIVYTQGPGLMGSLLVGGAFARSMAQSLGIPLIPVHHMHAHILAHFIEEPGQDVPEFPFLALTVSGGHTQIVQVNSAFDFVVLGATTDDAVGEAFDKTAKVLGLPYPGGPLIDQYAALGNPKAFVFTHPKVPGLDFSFSGLKTQIMYFIQKQTAQNPEFVSQHLHDICASVQHTIIAILMDKLAMAVVQTGITQIAIGGGVSANSGLRQALEQARHSRGWTPFIPKFEYTTDNAAMIGICGYLQQARTPTAPATLSKARMDM